MPRFLRRTRRSWTTQILVAVLMAALAFTVVVQVRQTNDETYTGMRKSELVELLKSLDSANDRVNKRIREMTTTHDELQTDTRKNRAAKKLARERAERLSILAGAVPAAGPGIEIVIEDPEHFVDSAILLDAVQELRDAGAEVLAVNSTVRIVAQSYFLDDDDQISIDGHTIRRPFTIEAIGDPHTLSSAMKFRGGLDDRVTARGASVKIREHSKISISVLAELKADRVAEPDD